MIDVHLSLLEAVLKSQLDVLAHGLAFLLGKARHDRKEHLSLSVQRVYGLLFKIDRDVPVLELPDVLEAVPLTFIIKAMAIILLSAMME